MNKRFLLGSIVLMAATEPAGSALLVSNGGFETNGGVGQIGYGITTLANWTVGGGAGGQDAYVFVANGKADSTGFPTVYSPPNTQLWGLGDGSANGFSASPSGGAFLMDWGFYGAATVSQTISGLTVGNNYTLSFSYAAAQVQGYSGATTSNWNVGFGSDTALASASIASKGFSGWSSFSQTFKATSASQTLSFLASSTGNGAASLLDNVQLTPAAASVAAVPEPESWVMMIMGFGAIGALLRRRRAAALA